MHLIDYIFILITHVQYYWSPINRKHSVCKHCESIICHVMQKRQTDCIELICKFCIIIIVTDVYMEKCHQTTNSLIICTVGIYIATLVYEKGVHLSLHDVVLV